MSSLTRRDVMKLGVLGTAALALPTERIARSALTGPARLDPARLPAVGQLPFAVPPTATPRPTHVRVPGTWVDPDHPAGTGEVSTAVDFYELRMKQIHLPVLPGLPPTLFWAYDGSVPGPTIHVERGRPIIVRHHNDLFDEHPVLKYGPPETSVHLHGNASLPQHDGYASDCTAPGGYKDYWYPAVQDARTLWYHDHGVHQTAPNAFMGLAAQYHLHDDGERVSGLPLEGPSDQYGNPYDVPMIVRDAMFDTDGQLLYDDHDHSGFFGDVLLANGVPWPTMTVEPRQYRFRILDASLTRSLELALSIRGSAATIPLTVVGTDGGIMEIAQSTSALRIGPAERYEVVIDFTAFKGRTLELRNLKPKNNIEYANTGSVMLFKVGRTVSNMDNNATVPGKRLRDHAAYCMDLAPTASTPTRRLDLVRDNGHWTINGKTWEDVVASGFEAALVKPQRNSVELWTISNPSGGWFHPFHVHLIDFKIVSRTGGKRGVQSFERGPKDVVYVGENETVTVIARFGPQVGRYMMHCHNLVHEDHDMMHQFWVQADNGRTAEDHDPMGTRATDEPGDGSLCLPTTTDGLPQMPPAA
jgi:FtsP/CotA-like multicopper oxidase with cupredoxin domain